MNKIEIKENSFLGKVCQFYGISEYNTSTSCELVSKLFWNTLMCIGIGAILIFMLCNLVIGACTWAYLFYKTIIGTITSEENIVFALFSVFPLIGLIAYWIKIRADIRMHNYIYEPKKQKKQSNLSLMWESFKDKVCFEVEFK
jgi:hypothetical protein